MYSVLEFQGGREEYEAILALNRIVSPDSRGETVDELMEEEANWPADKLFKRFVVQTDGEVVAAGVCFEAYWEFQAGTVHLHFEINPEHSTEQILPALYAPIIEFLKRREEKVLCLACGTSEEDGARVQFLKEKGYEKVMGWVSSELPVAELDLGGFGPVTEQVALAGIRIVTLRQLKEMEPDWKRKLRDLRYALHCDAPSLDPASKPSLSEFEEMVLRDPALVEDAFFVALAKDSSFIGMSNVWRNDATGKRLDAGLTGVERSFRRKKIATALKMHTIRYAQAAGAETISTRNEEQSVMFKLNLALGFEPGPAWLSLRKTIDTHIGF